MEKKVGSTIPGTRIGVENQLLLVSSGIPALDELLGGGLAVGTIALIEEDTQGIYSKTVLKYFLAEGVVSGHSNFIASMECDPIIDILFDIPSATVLEERVDVDATKKEKNDNMVIAFRYKNVPIGDNISHQFGHYFDLSKKMDDETIKKAPTFTWNGKQHSEDMENNVIFTNPSYWDLLQTIISTITDNQFLLTDKMSERPILRIVLHSVGSPLWQKDDKSTCEHIKDLRRFLVYLRYVVRKAFAVCVITVPTHFSEELKAVFDEHLSHNSDAVCQLIAFAGTALANNPALAEYHGFFNVTKLAAINSFKSYHPGSIEYTFKLKRKKFVIEKLHLPPALDIQEKGSDSDVAPKMPSFGCGSSSKNLLEF